MNKIQAIEKDIEQLYDHAKVANEEMTTIKTDLAEVKTNIAWLMKFFWIVATSSIGAFLGSLWQLIAR